jgi:hypothetical protein
VQWLVLLLIGLCAACTGPNPAYEAFPLAHPGDAAPEAARDAGAGLDGAAYANRSDGASGLPNGRLVGYWRFDEAPGATTATDSSGNGNHGVLEALDPAQVWVTGHSGNAIEFASGADPGAGVRVALSQSLASIQKFTVSAWIYRPALLATKNTSVLSRQLSTQSQEIYNLNTLNDELVIWASTDISPAPAVRIAGAAPVGVWMHVAATFDGASLRLYRDGQLLGTTPLTRALPTDSSPLYIGTNKNATRNDVFLGLIDEVALFAVPLSDAAIMQLATGTAPTSL